MQDDNKNKKRLPAAQHELATTRKKKRSKQDEKSTDIEMDSVTEVVSVSRGFECLTQQDYSGATAKFGAAIATNPCASNYFYRFISSCLSQSGTAIDDLQQAINLDKQVIRSFYEAEPQSSMATCWQLAHNNFRLISLVCTMLFTERCYGQLLFSASVLYQLEPDRAIFFFEQCRKNEASIANRCHSLIIRPTIEARFKYHLIAEEGEDVKLMRFRQLAEDNAAEFKILLKDPLVEYLDLGDSDLYHHLLNMVSPPTPKVDPVTQSMEMQEIIKGPK